MAATVKPISNVSWSALDSALLAVLMIFALGYTASLVHWHTQPFEDSLMLLRYADHLAHGAGIVWNIGEKPVEGATDFLFLISVAGVMKAMHLHPILACRLLLTVCQALGVGLLYFGTRRVFGAGRVLAASLALFYAMGPGEVYVTGGFSPPFYGLMALAAWFFACRAVVDGPDTASAVGFGVFALLTGLTRPDGVFLALFMAAAVWYFLGRRALRMLAIAGGIFAVFGGMYFLWRYNYFGYLLPNPFYKKGGGHLYPASLRFSLSSTLKMILPVTPFLWFAAFRKDLQRRVIYVLIPVVCFACMWILLTVENDWNARFQFVGLPIVLFSIPYLASGLKEELPERWQTWSRWMSVSTVLAVVVGSGLYWKVMMPPVTPDGSSIHEIAAGLAPLKGRDYTMAVTEAGTLPYFSGWRTIDAWGLNDAHIMHDPNGMTDAYLDESRPAIIMYHVGMENHDELRHVWLGDGGLVSGPPRFNGPLSRYAVTHNYELVARWGAQPCNVHIWYVRRDIPDFAAIKAIILRQPHFFLDGGAIATNYMQASPPEVCSDPGQHLGWRE